MLFRSQTAIADVDTGVTKFVHPASFPTAIFLLEIEEGEKVCFVLDADRGASEDAHGESQCIAFRSDSLLNAMVKDGEKGMTSFSPFDLLEETSHEEQEALWSGIVTSAIGISPVDQDVFDPSESLGELMTASIGVEEGQDVHADDWVKTQSLVIKIGLSRRVR